MNMLAWLERWEADPMPPLPVVDDSELSIVIDWPVERRVNLRTGAYELQGGSRMRLVIEGNVNEVKPYVDAMYEIRRENLKK